jgi:ABC transport system ATP-binding/permease protein
MTATTGSAGRTTLAHLTRSLVGTVRTRERPSRADDRQAQSDTAVIVPRASPMRAEPRGEQSRLVRIDALNLYVSSNNATLLEDISLCIPPHTLVALIGSSGVGKSTLMNALSGMRPAQPGRVLYNGQDYYHNLAAFSTQLGYVPQDDIVHRDLTVERALYYAARLRLSDGYTDQQIEERITAVLDEVEIANRRKLLIRNLSGGQRKRVSIALELLANPGVFFLDEPTSGLDPGLERKMMLLLRKLADEGRTIVLVTHSTTNIHICDYVCFLAAGGRLAYFGPPKGAKTYFGKTDFADIYSGLESTDEKPNAAEEAEARFRRSKTYERYIARPLQAASQTNGTQASPATAAKRPRMHQLRQLVLLTQRNVELLKNNRSNLITLLLQAPLLALLLMLLVRFEIGTGIFNASSVVQCVPQIVQTMVRTTPSAANPTGAVRIGVATTGMRVGQTVDCTTIRQLLSGDPKSAADPEMIASAQVYVRLQAGGDVNKALQDFIVPGGGINAMRALFIMCFIAVLFGVINGTREIVKEASIYRRERAVNLGILPYVFSKIAVLGVFAALQSLVLMLIVDAFEPFARSVFLPVLIEIYLSLVLTAFVGLLIGLVTSAFAANEDSANSLLPFILIPQVVFAGVEIPLKNGPLQLAATLFPTRWAMTALGSSIGLHSDKLGGDALIGSDSSFHGTLYSTYSQVDAMHRIFLAWCALGLLMVLFAVLICVGLTRKDAHV